MNIQKIFSEFIGGFFFAMISYLPVVGVYVSLNTLGGNYGRPTILLILLFFGYPLGSVLGILLVDKIIFKDKGWNALAIGVSVGVALMAGFGGFIILEKVGGFASVLTPAFVASAALIGYNIVSVFRR